MRFVNLNNDREYTIADLKKEWKVFRSEDPQNHADCFGQELLEIIDDTIRGRNDCEIIGMTPQELDGFLLGLVEMIGEE